MSRLNTSSLQVNDLITNPLDPSAGNGRGHMHRLAQALLGECKNKMGFRHLCCGTSILLVHQWSQSPGGMLSPYEAVRSPRYKGQSGVQLEDTTGVQCIVFLSEQPW